MEASRDIWLWRATEWDCQLVMLFVTCMCVCVCVSQIAPAENPDVTERMVIITGTPEAQFKVKTQRAAKWPCAHSDCVSKWTFHKCSEHVLVQNWLTTTKKTKKKSLWITVCPHICPSLSPPHPLLSLPGPGADIWEAEGGELLHCQGGGQTGDTHQGSFHCGRQGYWQRWQNGERKLMSKCCRHCNMKGLSVIIACSHQAVQLHFSYLSSHTITLYQGSIKHLSQFYGHHL